MSGADLRIQPVFAAHLITLASGHVEFGLREILRNYAKMRGNNPISNYVGKMIDRENSVNNEKVKKVLDRFDTNWFVSLSLTVSQQEREAVDSLKTLRDLIAHGRPNGTGYLTVKRYTGDAYSYVERMASVIG